MNKNKREGAFIPCGDSMEKMDEIRDEALKNVTGGNAEAGDLRKDGNLSESDDDSMLIIPII